LFCIRPYRKGRRTPRKTDQQRAILRAPLRTPRLWVIFSLRRSFQR
jgi:hypothetical protein